MNFGARVCPEMFLVGGWVLPELQQICGVQFGSGTNPGGHVTVSFGATVIFCVDGPLEYFHTHLPHFRLCVSEILWPSLMHVGPDTFLSSGLHGIAAVDLEAEPYRDRVATTEVQNAWSSRDSRRLQIVPGSALAGNSNCKNRVTELRFLVISRQ